ncbi:hypothetical protein ADIS_4359 [Lunatimonas lonarensis]|uniref:Uncharacterized protein n=1 Tax=Lunatimonas lonarensis TaxID=1232681 RepID=R7ZM61_9BACT|nr:hypothetical protein ADIS_4359 [Lunatimonas lonarensis]
MSLSTVRVDRQETKATHKNRKPMKIRIEEGRSVLGMECSDLFANKKALLQNRW